MTNNPMAPIPILFYLGAILLLIKSKMLQKIILLLIPTLSLIIVVSIPKGDYHAVQFLGYNLVLTRLDSLSLPFAIIFTMMAILGFIYSIHHDDILQHASAMIYAGSAIGVVLAGDWFSLYVYWELMAISSTFLILARKTGNSTKAAYRYFMVHVLGGLLLLAGILMEISANGNQPLGPLELKGTGRWLIFWGVALNGAIPPLHVWLKDAYPESTVTGGVFLSAFTTKSAVYVMARMFMGAEVLIWLGAIMTILPVFYAEIENDLRRVLSYSIVNQVGFMMCGVGIGTQLALNGAVAHAFCHIIYKALLFMSTGAVLHMTGRIRCTELGGIYKTMPLSALFCMIAAASISAFPLFSGFTSKSMIISASGHQGLLPIWIMLQFASAGVIAHAGLKVPYFTFFGHDRGLRTKEAPVNMLIAMGICAFLCVFLGVNPEPLYRILPYPVDYIPYTGIHVVAQFQLLLFAILAFYLMLKGGVYPPELKAINLDLDWLYRKGLGGYVMPLLFKALEVINGLFYELFVRRFPLILSWLLLKLPGILVGIILSPVRPFVSGGRFRELWARVLERLEKEPSYTSMTFAVGAIALIWLLL